MSTCQIDLFTSERALLRTSKRPSQRPQPGETAQDWVRSRLTEISQRSIFDRNSSETEIHRLLDSLYKENSRFYGLLIDYWHASTVKGEEQSQACLKKIMVFLADSPDPQRLFGLALALAKKISSVYDDMSIEHGLRLAPLLFDGASLDLSQAASLEDLRFSHPEVFRAIDDHYLILTGCSGTDYRPDPTSIYESEERIFSFYQGLYPNAAPYQQPNDRTLFSLLENLAVNLKLLEGYYAGSVGRPIFERGDFCFFQGCWTHKSTVAVKSRRDFLRERALTEIAARSVSVDYGPTGDPSQPPDQSGAPAAVLRVSSDLPSPPFDVKVSIGKTVFELSFPAGQKFDVPPGSDWRLTVTDKDLSVTVPWRDKIAPQISDLDVDLAHGFPLIRVRIKDNVGISDASLRVLSGTNHYIAGRSFPFYDSYSLSGPDADGWYSCRWPGSEGTVKYFLSATDPSRNTSSLGSWMEPLCLDLGRIDRPSSSYSFEEIPWVVLSGRQAPIFSYAHIINAGLPDGRFLEIPSFTDTQVTIYYRLAGDENWLSASLPPADGDTAYFPFDFSRPGRYEYWLEIASDDGQVQLPPHQTFSSPFDIGSHSPIRIDIRDQVQAEGVSQSMFAGGGLPVIGSGCQTYYSMQVMGRPRAIASIVPPVVGVRVGQEADYFLEFQSASDAPVSARVYWRSSLDAGWQSAEIPLLGSVQFPVQYSHLPETPETLHRFVFCGALPFDTSRPCEFNYYFQLSQGGAFYCDPPQPNSEMFSSPLLPETVNDPHVMKLSSEPPGPRSLLSDAAVSPNPADGPGKVKLSFDLSRPAGVKVQVFDLAGREIASRPAADYPDGAGQISGFLPEDIESGLYLVKFSVQAEDGRQENKLLKLYLGK